MTSTYTVKYFDGPEVLPSQGNSLSLVLSGNAVQFAVFRDGHKTLIALCEIVFDQPGAGNEMQNIDRVLADYRLTQASFSRVHITLLNRDFTMIPDAFYAESFTPAMLSFATGTVPQTSHAKKISGLHFCYGDTGIARQCEKSFPNAVISHAGVCTLSFATTFRSVMHADLFLQIHHNAIELSARKGNDIIFYNLFPFESDEDVLYYLLFTMDQLQFNPLETRLCISGQLPVTAPLCISAGKYIRDLSFAVRPGDLAVQAGSDLPSHYYFTLLNQHLCAF